MIKDTITKYKQAIVAVLVLIALGTAYKTYESINSLQKQVTQLQSLTPFQDAQALSTAFSQVSSYVKQNEEWKAQATQALNQLLATSTQK